MSLYTFSRNVSIWMGCYFQWQRNHCKSAVLHRVKEVQTGLLLSCRWELQGLSCITAIVSFNKPFSPWSDYFWLLFRKYQFQAPQQPLIQALEATVSGELWDFTERVHLSSCNLPTHSTTCQRLIYLETGAKESHWKVRLKNPSKDL